MQIIPRLTTKIENKEGADLIITLTPLVTTDEAILKYTRWINDEEIAHWIDKSYRVINFDDEKTWATTSNGEIRFSIYAETNSSNPILIGMCSLTLSSCNTNATLGLIIGDKDYRHRGIGLTVVNMLTKYAFEELRVHRCHILMVEDNEKALKCYTKAGYTVCGTEHECFWYHGHYANVLHLEYLFNNYKRE